jgi:hypothetical protein
MSIISRPETTHASKVGFVTPINIAFILDIICHPKFDPIRRASQDDRSRLSPLTRASPDTSASDTLPLIWPLTEYVTPGNVDLDVPLTASPKSAPSLLPGRTGIEAQSRKGLGSCSMDPRPPKSSDHLLCPIFLCQ